MPRLLPGTLLLEGVSGVVEEVPGVEEHEGENMEDLDIIRHKPRSSPTAGRPTPVDGRDAETVIGLMQPSRGPGGVGEATDQRPFSGPLESAPIRAGGPFSGPQCASCPASLAPGDGHRVCFRCLGAEHAAAALVATASCAACRALPEEGLLSRHLLFSPSVNFAGAIDIFGAGVPDAQDAGEHFEVDDVASLDDVFPGSASEFSRSRASTKATIVPGERPCRMADLFGEIMGEAAAIKGIPMPAPPLTPMLDDMQGDCFRTLSSSRRVTQCPLFPPVQHLYTAAGGDPSTLKAPKEIAGLTDRVFVCASQSAAAVNNIALLSSALVSLSAGREAYGPEEAARWLAVSRFSSAILQLCQPVAVSASRHMAWATMIQRAIWLSHTRAN
ncbi:unnamed protein product [Boreogadus saida]